MCVAAEHHARSWAQQYDLLASVLTRTVGGTVAAHTVHVEVVLLTVFPVGTNGRFPFGTTEVDAAAALALPRLASPDSRPSVVSRSLVTLRSRRSLDVDWGV